MPFPRRMGLVRRRPPWRRERIEETSWDGIRGRYRPVAAVDEVRQRAIKLIDKMIFY